jgi:hypothetical protein
MPGTGETSIFDDNQFHEHAANVIEALLNLNYLIREEAENPEKVLYYASMSQERLAVMVQALHSRSERLGWHRAGAHRTG